MLDLLQVVAPVFLVTGVGYLCVRLGYVADGHIDGLNRYVLAVAIPCLLFEAVRTLDLQAVFDWPFLLAFYAGSTITFFLGIALSRTLFGRRPGEAVVIGFGALFSNSVILGLPITERAWGDAHLQSAYAIIAVHAPFCYLLGITMMEISRADGRGPVETAKAVGDALFRNTLTVALGLGFVANLIGLALPAVVSEGLDLIVASALPVALFGLGGVLTRYRIKDAVPEALLIAFLSLVLHPAITFALGYGVLDLSLVKLQTAVTVASMAPGVNLYIFATLYRRAEGAAASAVLLATLISVVSSALWLAALATV